MKTLLSLILLLSQVAFAQKSILDEPGEVVFDGYIGDHYDILLFLKKTTGNKFEGRYLYKKQATFISLAGDLRDNKLQLIEKDPKGATTGKFSIDLASYPTLRGEWTKPNGTGKLNVYAKRIPVIGPAASTPTYDFVKVKSTKVGRDTVVVASGLPAPVLNKVNALLHVSRNSDTQSMTNTVVYNLGGILTVFYNEGAGGGWSSSQFVCINVKEGRPLKFGDIFPETAKQKMLDLYAAKVLENCPEQLDKTFKPDTNALDAPIVTPDGISFISPCERSIGYYQGPFTVEFEFGEIGSFLKK
jgi:hypothetical protein